MLDDCMYVHFSPQQEKSRTSISVSINSTAGRPLGWAVPRILVINDVTRHGTLGPISPDTSLPLTNNGFASADTHSCQALWDIAAFVFQHATFSHPTSSLLKISPCSPGCRWMAFGLRRAKVSVQLVFKISNICDPDPPTSQTDGHTDDMQSQYRALHYSASRGKNSNTNTLILSCLQLCASGPYSYSGLNNNNNNNNNNNHNNDNNICGLRCHGQQKEIRLCLYEQNELLACRH